MIAAYISVIGLGWIAQTTRIFSVLTVNERTVAMQKGDMIRARFLTIPEPFPGVGATTDKQYPVRKATVVYVHPKGRYIVAECKGVRETFFPEDVQRL